MVSMRLPRLGQTMESGRIERWLKAEHESFQADDALYEVETDKVTVEVNAHGAGSLVRIVAPPGEEIAVGEIVAVIAEIGESWTDDDVDAHLRKELGSAARNEGQSPAFAGAAADASSRARQPVMPRARMLAEELGVDLSRIMGTGAEGAVTVEDVRSATAGRSSARIRERRKLDGALRRMATVVTESWRTVPQFVQHVEVSGEALAARRASEADMSITVGDLLLAAVVRAAVEVPAVNATLDGDELVIYEDVNVALAVATDAGLLVPVFQRAQELELPELARRSHELAAKAHAGSLELVDVEGGTITFSNLGMAGIDLGVPLVTAPQAAIVFAGAIRTVPELDGATVRPVRKLWMSGAFDHRIVDGAAAARFMSALKEAVESL